MIRRVAIAVLALLLGFAAFSVLAGPNGQGLSINSAIGTAGQLIGTTTNDNACAGCVGEFKTSTSGSTAIATGTPTDLTSVSLTPGDWDCRANVEFIPGASATITQLIAWVSSSSATLPALTVPTFLQATFTTGSIQTLPVTEQRFSLSATTSVFVSAQDTHAISTMNGIGNIQCRRVR